MNNFEEWLSKVPLQIKMTYHKREDAYKAWEESKEGENK